jgi:hypothetical protein
VPGPLALPHPEREERKEQGRTEGQRQVARGWADRRVARAREGGEARARQEEPPVVREDGAEGENGQEPTRPLPRAGGEEDGEALDPGEERGVVRAHEAERGPERGAERAPPRREGPERGEEERRARHEVGVGDRLDEGEDAGPDVERPLAGQPAEEEEEAAEAAARADEQQAREAPAARKAGAGEPPVGAEDEGGERGETEEAVGEEGSSAEQGGQPPDREPLEVDERRGERRVGQLVAEDERPALRLLDVAQVVVEVVDVVERTDEDGTLRREEPGPQRERDGDGDEEQEDERGAPRPLAHVSRAQGGRRARSAAGGGAGPAIAPAGRRWARPRARAPGSRGPP